jgi:hypothetical protein
MNRNNWILKLAVTALVGLAVVASPAAWAKEKKEKVEAVSGPSAQETVQFINGLWVFKFTSSAPTGDMNRLEDTSYQYNAKLEQHNLQISLDMKTIQIASNSIRYTTSESSYSLPLDKLLPDVVISTTRYPFNTRIKRSGGFLSISCNPSAGACIREEKEFWQCSNGAEFDGSGCTPDTATKFSASVVGYKKSTEMEFAFPTPEAAERAAKALKHLIEISGGKPSLF